MFRAEEAKAGQPGESEGDEVGPADDGAGGDERKFGKEVR